jgi:hypothetical protein
MVRRDGAAIRKERMQEIARTIQRLLQNHSELSFSRTVSTFAYETGLTKEKINEYFEIMEGLGHFVLDKEGDKIKRAFEAEKEVED